MSYSAYYFLSITTQSKIPLLLQFSSNILVPHRHHKTSRSNSFNLCVFISQLTAVCLTLSLLSESSPIRVLHGDLLNTSSAASLLTILLFCPPWSIWYCLPWVPLFTSAFPASLTIPFRAPLASVCSWPLNLGPDPPFL